MLKNHRAVLTLISFIIVLPICALAVIGFSASGTASCRNCLAVSDKPLDLSFSELMRSPTKYTDQLIRIKAVFDHDAGYTFLRDPVSRDWTKAMPLGFSKDFLACAATQKSLTFHTGLGTWYDGIALVTVIGRYGIVADQRKFQTGQIGFTVLCIDEVRPSRSRTGLFINAIRYSIARVGRGAFRSSALD